MGSDVPGPETNDTTPHQVTLSAFKMSETEITNEQYITFLNAAIQEGLIVVEGKIFPSPLEAERNDGVIGSETSLYPGEVFVQLSDTGGATSDGKPESDLNRSWIQYDQTSNTFTLINLGDGVDRNQWPVTWIKWYGASAFAKFYGGDLPSEAQWEYTARSGNNDTVYSTSTGALDFTLANYNGTVPNEHNEEGHVSEVKSYAPNPWGFYDMSGNVWEWCQDYYDEDFYEQSDQTTDPVNEISSEKRVKRGGSWNFHEATLATYARGEDFPDRGNNHFGFRVIQASDSNTRVSKYEFY